MSLGFRYQPLRVKPRPGARCAMHSGQAQKGGWNREGRTDSTDSRGHHMHRRQSKSSADGKAQNLATSMYGERPDRPRADDPAPQGINKLAATVVTPV
jgi:hypothetical protein